jgi:hypothetical protein
METRLRTIVKTKGILMKEFDEMNLEERIATVRGFAHSQNKPKEETNKTIQLMRISDLLDSTQYLNEFDADYSHMTTQELIDKWQPFYDRLLKIKAFL